MTRRPWATKLIASVAMLAALASSASVPAGASGAERDEDAAITTRVKAAIENIPDIAAPRRIRVRTEGGVVWLWGYVDFRYQLREVTEAAGKVGKVKSVESRLRVKNYSPGTWPRS